MMKKDQKYEMLKNEINTLYCRCGRICRNLPQVENPEKQIEILEKRTFIKLKKFFDDPKDNMNIIKSKIEWFCDFLK